MMRFIATLCLLAVPAMSQDSPLRTLRRTHPRIIALPDDLARVRKLIETDSVARGLHAQLVEEAGKLLTAPPVEYVKVGPRLLAQSRRCLDRVYALGLLYRLDGDRRYLERAKKELFAAESFPDWNPSHFLDTAEMSHAFAIGYDWLYDSLTEQERARLRVALVEKGLKPSLTVYRSGRGWSLARHNWNQVCNGGISIGALAIGDDEPELAATILNYALESIKLPMAEYAPDGGWKEGPGYWHYATRYNVYFLAALESALGTDFGLARMPGFNKAGLFRIYFTGPAGLTFNYADAHPPAGNAAEMFWLARKFDEPVYAWQERQLLKRPDALDLLWYEPKQKSPTESKLPLHALFRGVDVAFFRSAWEDPAAIFVGFKGGDNKANHSHVDLGSFVLDAHGVRWAHDLGGDDYNLPGYFGKQRWSYFRLRTESHNTLTINGENQDPRAAAPIVKFGDRPEFGFAVADLSAAYGATRLQRGIALIERKHVLIQDEILLPAPGEVLWTMMTAGEVVLREHEAQLEQGSAQLHARILSPDGARFAVLPANPPPPQSPNPDCKRLVVRLPDKVTSTSIAVVLSPVRSGEKPARFNQPPRSLRDWN